MKEAIEFPTGQGLHQVIADFKSLGSLPRCGRAADSTFMVMRKPLVHGDAFWCYIQHIAVLILAACDACEVFTYVNAGNARYVGDTAAYHNSRSGCKVERRYWLGEHPTDVNDTDVYPYLVGDAAYALDATMLKSNAVYFLG